MVLAKILDANNCAMVYGLDPHHNCTRVFTGGACTGHPGESVYLFRSDSGECDFKSHDDKCTADLWIFNVLMVLPGIPATFLLCYLPYE